MRRIVRMWEELPQEDKELGMEWYLKWHRRLCVLAGTHHKPRDMVIGVFAALSPMVTLDQCWQDTGTTLRGIPLRGLPTRVYAAWQIRGGARPDDVLRAPKVRSFYHCLLNPEREVHSVCIDRHMYRIYCAGLRRKMPKVVTRRGYRLAADLFRKAANHVGVLPHQLQAALWISERGDHS